MILDNNALSAWAEGRDGIKISLHSANKLVVPSIVLGEYYFGIRQSHNRHLYEDWLTRYLPLTEIATITSTTGDSHTAERRLDRCTGPPAFSECAEQRCSL